MNCKSNVTVFCTVLAAVALPSLVTGQTPPGNETPKPIDATTLELYRQYIAPIGKIESDSVWAAIVLVAARGHGVPEFRELLRKDFATSRQEDRRGYDSRKLLSLITAVLGREGGERWQREEVKRTGIGSSRALPLRDDLDRESLLLADVIKYGRECGRSEIDDFAFAVRLAHHPQGKQFLLDVLHNPVDRDNPVDGTAKTKGQWPDNIGGGWEEARFYAAVGLAELGVEDGVRWLIEHARPNEFGLDGHVDRHPHASTRTSSLRANCNAVLFDLSGLQTQGDGSHQDWDAWWHNSAATFTPRPVALK
jgi:hypothetical protein